MQKTMILVILVSGIFLFGCLDNINNSGSSIQYSAYVNNQSGFSTVKPNDWVITEKPGQVPLTTFSPPGVSGISINIISIVTSNEITSQGFFSGLSPQLASSQTNLITNVKVIVDSTSQLVIDNQTADRNVKRFSFTRNGKNEIGSYDTVFIKNGDRYTSVSLITACSSDAHSCDQLNSNYEQVFSKIIENLKFN
jgi:hypothetical protein